MKRNVVLALVTLIVATGIAGAFEPVVVAGTDLQHLVTGSAGATAGAMDLRPRLALGWRDQLDAGGYFSLDGLVSLAIPVDGRRGVSDSEMLDLLVSVPLADDELLLGAGVQSSFVSAGAARMLATPDWSVDYRFGNDAGWLALQSDGSYRFNEGDSDDHLTQRVGLGYSRSTTIRFALEANALGGYEVWPEYDVVDESGAATGGTRRDLTVQLDATADGLMGYFTTWSVSGVSLARFSNATRYLDTGIFEPDPESRLIGRLAGSLRTSPNRRMGLGGRVTVEQDVYLSRPARDENGASLGRTLSVTDLSARIDADFNPVSAVYLVGSVGGGATLSPDPAYDRWYVQAMLGIEYSF